MTGHADLDGVALDGLHATLQSVELGARRGTGPSRRETRAEDVGHLDEVRFGADRAALTPVPSQVPRRSQQLGVGIAHLVATDLSGGETRQEGPADESELDHRSARRPRESPIHWVDLTLGGSSHRTRVRGFERHDRYIELI